MHHKLGERPDPDFRNGLSEATMADIDSFPNPFKWVGDLFSAPPAGPQGSETIQAVFTPQIPGTSGGNHMVFVFNTAKGRFVAQAYPNPTGGGFFSEVVPLTEDTYYSREIDEAIRAGQFRTVMAADSVSDQLNVARLISEDMNGRIDGYDFNLTTRGSPEPATVMRWMNPFTWQDNDNTFADMAAKAMGVELWPDFRLLHPNPYTMGTGADLPYGNGAPLPTTVGEVLDPRNPVMREAERTPADYRTSVQQWYLSERDELLSESATHPPDAGRSLWQAPDGRQWQAEEQAYHRTQEGATDPVIEVLAETAGEPPEPAPPASRFSVMGPVPAAPQSPLGDRLQQLEEQNAPPVQDSAAAR